MDKIEAPLPMDLPEVDMESANGSPVLHIPYPRRSSTMTAYGNHIVSDEVDASEEEDDDFIDPDYLLTDEEYETGNNETTTDYINGTTNESSTLNNRNKECGSADHYTSASNQLPSAGYYILHISETNSTKPLIFRTVEASRAQQIIPSSELQQQKASVIEQEKKAKRNALLEKMFSDGIHYLSRGNKELVARNLGLTSKAACTWFKNRRNKLKAETEVQQQSQSIANSAYKEGDDLGKTRTVFRKDQMSFLEQTFSNGMHYPTPDEKEEFAEQLGLRCDAVDNWFKNARAKLRKKQ